MSNHEQQTQAVTIAEDIIAVTRDLEQMHHEIMTLDALPINKGLALLRIYDTSSYVMFGAPSLTRDVQHMKSAWDADYRYKEKQLALSRERAEQRALWLVPLIRWGCGSVGSVALAATVWMLRFS